MEVLFLINIMIFMLTIGKLYKNKNRHYLILFIEIKAFKMYDQIYTLNEEKIHIYDRGLFEDCVEEL
jgi:hypothetical protein